MRPALLLMVVMALTGCAAQLDVAGAEWEKSGARSFLVTLDELECARGAADAGQTPDLILGGVLDVARVVIEERARVASFNGCMTAKGYTRKG